MSFIFFGCAKEVDLPLEDKLVGTWKQFQSIDSKGFDVTNSDCSIVLDLTKKIVGNVYETGSDCQGLSTNNGNFFWEVNEPASSLKFSPTDNRFPSEFRIVLNDNTLTLTQMGVFNPRSLGFKRQ